MSLTTPLAKSRVRPAGATIRLHQLPKRSAVATARAQQVSGRDGLCSPARIKRHAYAIRVIFDHASGAQFDATEAGVPNGGAILVRPDGFIGFRAVPGNERTMDALDAHLAAYLVPNSASDVRQVDRTFDNRASLELDGVTAFNR